MLHNNAPHSDAREASRFDQPLQPRAGGHGRYAALDSPMGVAA